MIRKGLIWVIGLLLLLPLLDAIAHEEDVFEMEDFIDPRELGARMTPEKRTISGGEYRFFDLTAGKIYSYQDRARFNEVDPSVVSLAYHKYYEDKQINHRLTWFEAFDGVPRYRLKSEFAKYSIGKSSSKDSELNVFRDKISLVIDDRDGDGAEGEISFSKFVELPPIYDFVARGGISASYRRANSENVYRGLWKSSAQWASEKGKILLNAAFWIGYEKSSSGSRFIPFRGKLELDYELTRATSAQLSFAPAYQTSAGDFPSGDNYEFAISMRYLFGATQSRGF